ncbi:MAG: hypothetical protein J0L82_18385 [Deltaproteobacteria bacterium]|nr:hypothetical protein [Deltaproteobacteria bacterium]
MKEIESIHHLDLKFSLEFERLLKEAKPSTLRLHQLVKTFQLDVPHLAYHDIEGRLLALYDRKYRERTSSVVSKTFGFTPYPWLTGQLHLNFSNAVVSETKKYQATVNLRHAVTSRFELPDAMATTSLLHDVVHRLTRPRYDQKNSGLQFDDFVDRWRHVCFQRFGNLYDCAFDEINRTLIELRSRPMQLHHKSPVVTDKALNPLEVSQTDLDWMKDILRVLSDDGLGGNSLPLYPLSRGPQNSTLVRVETLVRTLRVIPAHKHPPLKSAVVRTCSTLLKAFGQAP